MSKTDLDWLVALPWNVLSTDQLDFDQARAVLDADHYSSVRSKAAECGRRRLTWRYRVRIVKGGRVASRERRLLSTSHEVLTHGGSPDAYRDRSGG